MDIISLNDPETLSRQQRKSRDEYGELNFWDLKAEFQNQDITLYRSSPALDFSRILKITSKIGHGKIRKISRIIQRFRVLAGKKIEEG